MRASSASSPPIATSAMPSGARSTGPADKGAFDVVKSGKIGLAVDRARVHFAAAK